MNREDSAPEHRVEETERLFGRALRAEKQGDWAEAISIYEQLQTALSGQEACYTANCARRAHELQGLSQAARLLPEAAPTAARRPYQFSLRLLLALPLAIVVLGAVAHWFDLPGVLLTLGAGGLLLRTTRVIGVCFLAAFLVAYGSSAHRDARLAAHRSQYTSYLKQIALALHNYHDIYGSLPPAYIADANGRPMHSWRVLILPFTEREDLYRLYRFDEPWDGPNNRLLHGISVDVYTCPLEYGAASKGQTSYLAIVGPGTIWPGEKPVSFSQVTDGTGNTLMLVESARSGIHWMEPCDLDVERMNPTINPQAGRGVSSLHTGGANIAFADGRALFLDKPEIPRQVLTISGGEKLPSDW